MVNARSYSDKTVKLLYGKARGCCSKCRVNVFISSETGTSQNIGEIAHIYPFGNDQKAPRFNEIALDGFDPSKKDEYENLILLCPTCHKEIDKFPQDYPAKKLLKMKAEHEEWGQRRLMEETANIGFSELDSLCNTLVQQPTLTEITNNFQIIEVIQKIEKNNLSDEKKNLLKMGLSQANLVHEFLNNQVNVVFSEKVLYQIKKLYNELCLIYQGDDLYDALMDKINAGHNNSFSRQAAGNVIISYFFHICEIFKK